MRRVLVASAALVLLLAGCSPQLGATTSESSEATRTLAGTWVPAQPGSAPGLASVRLDPDGSVGEVAKGTYPVNRGSTKTVTGTWRALAPGIVDFVEMPLIDSDPTPVHTNDGHRDLPVLRHRPLAHADLGGWQAASHGRGAEALRGPGERVVGHGHDGVARTDSGALGVNQSNQRFQRAQARIAVERRVGGAPLKRQPLAASLQPVWRRAAVVTVTGGGQY